MRVRWRREKNEEGGGGVDKKKQVVEQNGQRDVKDGIFKKQKDVVD